jgi:aliphatic sulfonates family ABC transporter substrate-binding protein
LHLSRRDGLATIAAAIVAQALSGCARSAVAAPVAIGYQRSGLLLLAKARGTVDAALRAAGRPAAQWIEFPSGPPMLEAMAAGSVDIGATGESPPIFAQAAGAPLVYLAAEPITGLSSAILVHQDAPFRKFADLRGHKVAFTKASSAHLVVAKALRQAGMTFGDIVPINLSPADAAGAFAAGAIDAWSIWDPYYALTMAKAQSRAIVTGNQLPPSDAFLLGNRTTAAAKRDDLRTVLSALRSEAVWAHDNPDAVVTLTARQSGLPEAIVRIGLRRGTFAANPIGPDIIRRQQANADLLADLGLLPGKIDVASAIWRG